MSHPWKNTRVQTKNKHMYEEWISWYHAFMRAVIVTKKAFENYLKILRILHYEAKTKLHVNCLCQRRKRMNVPDYIFLARLCHTYTNAFHSNSMRDSSHQSSTEEQGKHQKSTTNNISFIEYMNHDSSDFGYPSQLIFWQICDQY